MIKTIASNFKIKIIAISYVLALAVLSLLLYYTYNEALTLIKGQFSNQQMFVAKQTAAAIEKNFISLVNGLEYLSKSTPMQNLELKESRKLMEATFKYVKNLYILDLTLLDSNGIVRISLKTPATEGEDLSSKEYFKKARALKKVLPYLNLYHYIQEFIQPKKEL